MHSRRNAGEPQTTLHRVLGGVENTCVSVCNGEPCCGSFDVPGLSDQVVTQELHASMKNLPYFSEECNTEITLQLL